MKLITRQIDKTFYQCESCPRQFETIFEAQKHEKFHKQETCSHSIAPYTFSYGISGNIDVEKTCSICGKVMFRRGLSDTEKDSILYYLSEPLDKYFERLLKNQE